VIDVNPMVMSATINERLRLLNLRLDDRTKHLLRYALLIIPTFVVATAAIVGLISEGMIWDEWC